MQKARRHQAFTLIELLTVIAIIAILAAILFPLAGTVREQARANDCMSKLHQLYVSSNVYRSDEGAFPPALLGLVEVSDGAGGSTGVYLTTPGSQQPASAERLISGFLYTEQTKDINLFRCPDNLSGSKLAITTAHFSATPPPLWPAGKAWIGQQMAAYGCPTDAYGTIDCFIGGPFDKMPKYYYVWDSFDIGPVVNVLGQPVTINGQQVYERHYSPDWTGSSANPAIRGLNDLPNQLKYANPPDDKTLLAYCTWHARTAKTGSVTSISNAGSAKKLNLKQMLDYGPNIYNR
jgi:prepilin-type N-terminal cleavage/methylation domain-containing protein